MTPVRFDAPPGGRITPPMARAYERDGFLIIDGFVPPETCAALRARAVELAGGYRPEGHATVFSTTAPSHARDDYFRGSGGTVRFFLEEEAVDADGRPTRPMDLAVNKIGHALHDLDPMFEEASRSPRMAGLAASLGFEAPLLLQSMYIFKQPGIGGEVVCHQDSTFLYTSPETCVGLWLAIDPATVDNGCLWALAGEHRGPLKARFRDEGGGLAMETHDTRPWDEDLAVPIEAPVGTLVVLHGRLPHRSDTNRSAAPRHAYTLHLIDGTATYPDDNWLKRPADLPLRGF